MARVTGYNRVPDPPARIMPFLNQVASDMACKLQWRLSGARIAVEIAAANEALHVSDPKRRSVPGSDLGKEKGPTPLGIISNRVLPDGAQQSAPERSSGS